MKNNNIKELTEGIESIYLKTFNIENMTNKAYLYVKNQTWKKMVNKIDNILDKFLFVHVKFN